MRIAIVGAGIAGLVTAYLLSRRHAVSVFEAASHVGGHTNTVELDLGDEHQRVDTGFVVFNDRTYPRFVWLLKRLGIAARPTTMSFSVQCERTGLEYNGTSINRLFADRWNLFRPSFHRMVLDILRFNRRAPVQALEMGDSTVGEFLEAHEYGARFRDHYLVPMGAAIWSCPPQTFVRFPMRFVMDFFGNHGMLQVHGRPAWQVVAGGSARYVEALTASFKDRIRLRTPVSGIRRTMEGISIRTNSVTESFDEVVVACHSDQALAILNDASPLERRVLEAFPYQTNVAVLHTDQRWLPSRRLAWAAWNYRIPPDEGADVQVTYNMNILQRLNSRRTFCVTLNPSGAFAPGTELRRFTYHHPVCTIGGEQARQAHATLIRHNRTSFCGAYWGYGFHEDGVQSALDVCAAYGERLA
ncbi:MAG: NAD(P)/FAD-dependent oxidoreductase [Acidobacteriota bacterium]